MQRLILWFIGNHTRTSATDYISDFFSCLKHLILPEDLQTLYEKYPRDVVVYADEIIIRKLRSLYGSYLRKLLKQERITRDSEYVPTNGESISEDDYNHFRDIAISEINQNTVMNVDRFTIQYNPHHNEAFHQYMRKYLHDAFGGESYYKYTCYTLNESIESISQLEYDRIMVYFIEVLRETLLRSVWAKNSHTSWQRGFLHPNFKDWVLKYIDEFVSYVSSQGEEIRTLDDLIEKEVQGDYWEETCAHARLGGDIYKISKDNLYHPIHFGKYRCLAEKPLFGKEPAKRTERPVSFTEKVWDTNE